MVMVVVMVATNALSWRVKVCSTLVHCPSNTPGTNIVATSDVMKSLNFHAKNTTWCSVSSRMERKIVPGFPTPNLSSGLLYPFSS